MAFSSLLFVSCQQKKVVEKVEETVPEISTNDQQFIGFWVGGFVANEYKEGTEFVRSNRINIIIKNIIGDSVIGQSVVAGNSMPLHGTIERGLNNSLAHFELVEPKNNKFNGKFSFDITTTDLRGSWESYDKTIPVTKRTFKLNHRLFSYDANLMLPANGYYDTYSEKQKVTVDTVDGKETKYVDDAYRAAGDVVYKINSSTHQFSEEELKNLKKLELEILRNTIFARHGFTFKKKGYRQFFDDVDWYVPVSDNVEAELTPLEKANIKLFARFEKYATDHYDTFGR